jgi:hypothetical protein
MLNDVQMYNETSFVHFFDGDVEYCQILTVNVTAVSGLGSSVPGSVSRGFPIGKNYVSCCAIFEQKIQIKPDNFFVL